MARKRRDDRGFKPGDIYAFRTSPATDFSPEETGRCAALKILGIRTTILELQALGPKPRKGRVRVVLKACVDWFNAKDREFGHVIETVEREDICGTLDELAFVARQRSLSREIDDWRNW